MIDIDGAYDLHVHSAPDLFPRIADDRQMVVDAAARGFAGVVMWRETAKEVRAVLEQRLGLVGKK